MKLVLTTVVSLFTSYTLWAQNGTLPDAVSQAFSAKFPKARMVKWTPEDVGEFSAIFVNDTVAATALYLDNGKWINTIIEVNPQKLPPGLVAAIKQKHPKAKIQKAGRVEHHKKGNYYELELKTKDVVETFYFSEEGTEVR